MQRHVGTLSWRSGSPFTPAELDPLGFRRALAGHSLTIPYRYRLTLTPRDCGMDELPKRAGRGRRESAWHQSKKCTPEANLGCMIAVALVWLVK